MPKTRKKNKRMDPYDREKLVQLRIDSKMGKQLTQEQQDWLTKMWREYPDDYPSNEEIHKLVLPLVNPMAGNK